MDEIKDYLRERREEASVTTFALVVTRVFIYSVNCGRRWTEGNLPEAVSR